MAFKVPADIAKAAIAAGCTKCNTTTQKLLVLGFLAGAYIAFGALLSEIVAGGLSNGTITVAMFAATDGFRHLEKLNQ